MLHCVFFPLVSFPLCRELWKWISLIKDFQTLGKLRGHRPSTLLGSLYEGAEL